jgi:ectoine hydroxylase-related dioxygenase (phytanoyl-CoA dioxygenase family)
VGYAEYHYEPIQPLHDETMKRLIRDTEPFEVTGSAGDTLFYHHRLIHTVGINTSDVVRQAVFCDYMRSDRPVKEDLLPLETTSYRVKAEREAVGTSLETDKQVQWYADTREYVQDTGWPPRQDMWEDWGAQVRAAK